MTHPTTTPSFDTLGLPETILKTLIASGYTTPTPIQAQSIPTLLEGRDLLGLAETGTGKTAAFALPILTKLAETPRLKIPKAIRALILAPTRELAIQIHESFTIYGAHLDLNYAAVYGGVGISPQIRKLQSGVDILVATPGRLIDLMGSKSVRFDHVQHFVLDEADRMLDMGFIRDVRRIVKTIPKTRQSLLFSATMPSDISSLAAEMLHNPVRVEVARAGTAVDRITQRVHFVDGPKKRAALVTLLKNPALARVIAFTRTKRGADRVARGLQAAGIEAHAIHGNKSQGARQAALEQFRSGRARVLVATDIAARGIDIDAITHVINYEIPNIPETYVHRIGRTARAGASGAAISFCAGDERSYLRDIERLTGVKIPDGGAIDGLAETDAALPQVKHNGRVESDAADGHFQRARGRVAGRRVMPRTLERDTWHEGKNLKGDADKSAGARSERSSRGGGSGGQGAPGRSDRVDRPRGDRAQSARPGSDRQRDDRPRGERPFRDGPRGPRADAPRNDGDRGPRAPRNDERRNDDRRGPPRGAGARPGGDRGDRRPRPPGPDRGGRSDRQFGERNRHDRDRDRNPPGADRSHEKPWQSRNRDSAPAGDRSQQDRANRGAPRADSERRGQRPAWQNRDHAPSGDRNAAPRNDRGPRSDGNRDRGPRNDRPRSDRPQSDRSAAPKKREETTERDA